MLRVLPIAVLVLGGLGVCSVLGQSDTGTLTDSSITWPGWAALLRVLTLQDYNTRVVVLGVACLGAAAGLIGAFMLLRERALLGDALSHATLPGIGLAFMVMVLFGGTGKWLPGLLLGASISGVLGVLCIMLIVRTMRIKQDAALGIVLSVFFGLGVAVTGIVQNMGSGHAAGLQSFIYGKTASMLLSDAVRIGVAGVIITFACLVLFKEFRLLCFDAAYARSQGWPVTLLDVVMMALVVGVTVIGLQAVGLILMIALLVIPPAAAKFWTTRLSRMVFTSALLGGMSCSLGAGMSALVPRLPAGAIIVCVAGLFFLISMFAGPARGVLARWWDQKRLVRSVARQNVLRAIYEVVESSDRDVPGAVTFDELVGRRTWSPREVQNALNCAIRGRLVRPDGFQRYALSDEGRQAAWRAVRNHRLWELYLITHADIAPSHVDRDADRVEHVLGDEMVAELEKLLADTHPNLTTPASPHRIDRAFHVERETA